MTVYKIKHAIKREANGNFDEKYPIGLQVLRDSAQIFPH